MTINIKGSKKGFCGHISSKRKSRESVGPEGASRSREVVVPFCSALVRYIWSAGSSAELLSPT